MKQIDLSDCLKMLRGADIDRESIYIENHKLTTYNQESLKGLYQVPVLLLFQDVKESKGIWHIYLRTKERR